MTHLGLAAVPIFDTDALDTIDLDSAFVTIDSNRINLTFRQIFKLLRAVGPNLANFEKLLASQGAELTKVVNDTAKLDYRTKEAEGRLDTSDLKLQKVAEVQHTHAMRLDSLEKRIAAQERQHADMKDLNEALSKMRSDVRQLQNDTEGLDETVRRHTNQIDTNALDLKKVNDAIKIERDRVTAIYNVFEMDEKKVLTANAHGAAARRPSGLTGTAYSASIAPSTSVSGDPSSPSKVPHPPSGATASVTLGSASFKSGTLPSTGGLLSHQVQYLFTLPAFAALRADYNFAIGEAEQRMGQELEAAVAKLNADISVLRGRIADKVDIRDFKPFEAEVKEALKRFNVLFANYEKLMVEIEGKADRAETEKKLQHLQTTKADKSDLLNMVTMDDIRALDKKIQDLSDAFDSLLGKLNLELANLRNMRNVPTTASSGDGMDPSLPGRVLRLESETKDLYNVKADKFQLQELFRGLEGAAKPILSSRPDTPPQESLKKPNQLAPISRPSSATAGSRAPHTPLQYTSTSPTRNPVYNKPRYSASATLFDSDGNRTPASVTAARAVGNIEHLHNVARHVANRGGDIPDDHTVHVLP